MKRRHSHKELSESQILKRRLKKLEEHNRSLRKQLKKKEREDQYKEPDIEEIELEEKEDVSTHPCPKCKSGKLQEKSIAGRLVDVCDSCTYRSRAKNI